MRRSRLRRRMSSRNSFSREHERSLPAAAGISAKRYYAKRTNHSGQGLSLQLLHLVHQPLYRLARVAEKHDGPFMIEKLIVDA